MKMKLKKGAERLESHSSHQGFPVNLWRRLNNGETVEFDSIPDDAKDQIEEVAASSTKKTSSKEGVKHGK